MKLPEYSTRKGEKCMKYLTAVSLQKIILTMLSLRFMGSQSRTRLSDCTELN